MEGVVAFRVRPSGGKVEKNPDAERLYEECGKGLGEAEVQLFQLRRAKASNERLSSGQYGFMIKGGNVIAFTNT